MKKYTFFLVFMLLSIIACKEDSITELPTPEPLPTSTLDTIPPAGTSRIAASPQRTGDANKGYEYLVTGNYVASGPPLEIYFQFLGEDNSNLLNRTGNNAKLPHIVNAVEAYNGVEVAGANCLTCHSEVLNGELVIGLGNTTFDYTENRGAVNSLLANALDLTYGPTSPERLAYEPFRRGTAVLADELITAVRGVNPAGKLAVVLGAYRDVETLNWLEEPLYEIPTTVIPSDVPPWWHTKKKNALYYAGIGRGDHSRTIMAASILTLQNTAEAEEIDKNFPDVLAYLKSIEPPSYPQTIDVAKSERGESIFNLQCAKCHGTYGDVETYPNLLVDLVVIKTDPLLASTNYGYGIFTSTYNNSWFGLDPNGAKLVPTNGYVAPPLDGIWATVPYLHNGSVPTLEDLLDSSQRPDYWERTFDSSDLDYEKVGWKYTRPAQGGVNTIYDTNLPGYSNSGHAYGDRLSVTERSDLIEYLKSL